MATLIREIRQAHPMIVEYLASGPLTSEPPRIQLTRPLPEKVFASPALQPLHGGR